MTRRRGRLARNIGPAALFVLIAVAVFLWPRLRDWYRPPRFELPDPADVVELRAQAWASGSHGYFESDVPEFTVPLSQVPRLWRRFDANQPDPSPQINRNMPLGELVARTRDGRVTRITFFDTGGDDLVFTTDREHFFRSEPRDEFGHPLGGGLLLAGTLRTLATVPQPVP